MLKRAKKQTTRLTVEEQAKYLLSRCYTSGKRPEPRAIVFYLEDVLFNNEDCFVVTEELIQEIERFSEMYRVRFRRFGPRVWIMGVKIN